MRTHTAARERDDPTEPPLRSGPTLDDALDILGLKKLNEAGRYAQKDLSIAEILRWADAHREHTGSFPNIISGLVYLAPAEKWRALDAALRIGSRGLAGGSSPARLLHEPCG